MSLASTFSYKLKTYSTSEISAGARVKVPLDQLPTSRAGRPLHIVALQIVATVQHTRTASGMTAGVMPGRLLPTVIRSTRMEAGGHVYIDNLDGGDLKFIQSLRYAASEGHEQDLTSADVTDDTDIVEITLPFGRPSASSKKRYDGVLPCALFVGPGRESNKLEFNVDSAFGSDGPTGAFPGVSSSGLTALTVFAVLAPLDRVRIATPWTWAKVTTPQSDHVDIEIKHRGPIEAVVMRNLPAGTPSHNISSIRYTLDGERIWDDMNFADRARSVVTEREGHPPLPSVTAPSFLPLFLSPVDENRTLLPTGSQLRIDYVEGGTNTRYDFLIMGTGHHDPAVWNKTALQAGAPAMQGNSSKPSGQVVFKNATASGKSTRSAAPVVDHHILWPGMPYPVSRAILNG
jgi:hypothetical protein